MNIFALDKDTVTAAKFHADKHVVKQILEYAQLLSTAHRVLDGELYIGLSKKGRKNRSWLINDPILENSLYKATHMNHPSGVWVRQSRQNYVWLYSLLYNLCLEYTSRYGKIHKVQRVGLLDILGNTPKNIDSDGNFTMPTPAMPDYCIVAGNVIQSYINCYFFEKIKLWSWKNQEVPSWLFDMLNDFDLKYDHNVIIKDGQYVNKIKLIES